MDDDGDSCHHHVTTPTCTTITTTTTRRHHHHHTTSHHITTMTTTSRRRHHVTPTCTITTRVMHHHHHHGHDDDNDILSSSPRPYMHDNNNGTPLIWRVFLTMYNDNGCLWPPTGHFSHPSHGSPLSQEGGTYLIVILIILYYPCKPVKRWWCYDFDRFRLYSRDRIQSVSDNAQASVQGASWAHEYQLEDVRSSIHRFENG